MTEAQLFPWFIVSWFGVAACVFGVLFFITAPYGRHERKGWGPLVPNYIGWIIMEAPAALVIAACFALRSPPSPGAWVFLALWELHYINRAFVFPFRTPGRSKPMPLVVALMGLVFCSFNGYLNGRSLTLFGPSYAMSYFTEPRAILGVAIFLCGWVINIQADEILIHLRKPGETGYKIPLGGMYRFISCPNYFGEILEWIGFAVAAGSPAAWSFAAWTAANLAPRAFTHHKWYRQMFPDYPKERKALIPFLL